MKPAWRPAPKLPLADAAAAFASAIAGTPPKLVCGMVAMVRSLPLPQVPPVGWSGLYVGANAGGAGTA
jgi:hypothetical protein